MTRGAPVTAGLVLLGLLSLLDVAGIALTDGEHPPMAVAVLGAALGVISLVLLVPAWRGGRGALIGLVAVRIVSALTAVPAFLGSGVPVPVVVAAAGIVVLTLIGCVLVAPVARRAGVEVAPDR